MLKSLQDIGLVTALSVATPTYGQETATRYQEENEAAYSQIVESQAFSTGVQTEIRRLLDLVAAENINERINRSNALATMLDVDMKVDSFTVSYSETAPNVSIDTNGNAIEIPTLSLDNLNSFVTPLLSLVTDSRVERVLLADSTDERKVAVRNYTLDLFNTFAPRLTVKTDKSTVLLLETVLALAIALERELPENFVCTDNFPILQQLTGQERGPTLSVNGTYPTPVLEDIVELIDDASVIESVRDSREQLIATLDTGCFREGALPSVDYIEQSLAEVQAMQQERAAFEARASAVRMAQLENEARREENEANREANEAERVRLEQRGIELTAEIRDTALYLTIWFNLYLDLADITPERDIHELALGVYKILHSELLFPQLTAFYQQYTRELWARYETMYPQQAQQIKDGTVSVDQINF